MTQAGYAGTFRETSCEAGAASTTCRVQDTVAADGAGYICQNGSSSVIVSVPSVPIGGLPVANTFLVRSVPRPPSGVRRVYCAISFARSVGTLPNAFDRLIVDVTV